MSRAAQISDQISQAVHSVTDKFIHPQTKTPLAAQPKYKEDPNLKMFAAEYHGAKNVKLVERAAPAITENNDAIVRITSTTVCGSDLHMYYNEVPGVDVMQTGDIMGHEAVGVVQSVGPSVTNIKPGDRVVISAIIACGSCEFCNKKQPSLCDRTNPSGQMEALYGHRLSGVFGYSHLTGGYAGLQAEYARVPFADNNLLKLPDNVSDEKAIFLSDVMCTAWHANELGEVTEGKNVCIWGCGPIGMMAAYLARFRKANKIIVIDNNKERLALCKRSVRDVITLNFDEVKIMEEIPKLIPGGPDCSLECAGYRFTNTAMHKIQRALKLESDSPEILIQMIHLTKKAGNIAVIGDYFASCNNFPIGPLMEKSITLRGGQLFVHKYWQTLLAYVASGQLDPTFEITHVMKFEEIAKAYKMFAEDVHNTLKIVLRTKNSPAYGMVQQGAQGQEQGGIATAHKSF